MLDSLKLQRDAPPPMLPVLLRPPEQQEPEDRQPSEAREDAASVASRFKLNADQAAALSSTAGWFDGQPVKVVLLKMPLSLTD